MDESLEPVRLCASAELVEKGRALLWNVLQWRRPARAFALRHEGRVVAYLNRCAHVPTEMDWQIGEFLDSRQEFIVCAIHGASFNPRTGRCVGGPCAGSSLIALRVEERGGEVYWYPSRDTRALAEDAPVDHESPP
jgi:nitrite reductase/ring-hydroxylating ferredoxin subunit